MKNRKRTVETVIMESLRENDGFIYRYFLIKKESARVASYMLPLYSVRVEMESLSGEVTSNASGDIFADEGKAIAFYHMLAENLATPIDLPYIIEDECGLSS